MSVIIDSVTKTFGAQKALDLVSFKVSEGEVVGFLGPNGAGKSTMMKIATGYLIADTGEVTICGQKITPDNTEVRKLIGYLPEHNPLYLEMYVREYLEMVGKLYYINSRDIKREVESVIERTGLQAECHKKIGALSKGYRQRVGIAQAIIGKPKVIILDEPTTGLDPNQIVDIRNLIKDLGREHSVILSTHIMQEVEAICDRIVLIDHGQIRAEGTPAEIQRMVGGTQIVEVAFEEKDVNISVLSDMAFVDHIDVKADSFEVYPAEGYDDIRPMLFRFAVENKLTLLTLNRVENSMEDLFHRLIPS
ncbi:MAG: ATP-binding cassette domain-containing protein [Bacteroidales bacterium]|nr:ATP-binding cassette domain-containing protein [Bacteroidales bacterium]